LTGVKILLISIDSTRNFVNIHADSSNTHSSP
jgi:hypothetical protein